MARRWTDRLQPTAIGLVSRAWVIDEVERRVADPAQRGRAVDALIEYVPPRRHPVRDNFIFWLVTLGLAMLAGALGAPPWIGFGVGLIGFAVIARVLAVQALRWRLARWLEEGR